MLEQLLKTATAAVGALVLTTIAVGAAVGPARSAETTPVYAAADTAQGTSQAHA